MSHINFESIKSFAVGHLMDVIVLKYPITSAMASSRLKETHYEIQVTDLRHDTNSKSAASRCEKKEIKSIEHIGSYYQVIFTDHSRLEHLMTGEEILSIVKEDSKGL